jgi:hypothetical protein
MTLQIKESFQDLVDQAAILIDKTMLVKEFLNDDHDVIMITRPYGWFKTQNIIMLKSFFERQLDENGQMMHDKKQTSNYKLFTERYKSSKSKNGDKLFEIAKYEDIIKTHLGEYPIIYLDLKDRRINLQIKTAFVCYENILEPLKKCLGESKKHLYEAFFDYIDNDCYKYTREQVIDSLRLLSEILYIYYGKKPFIFIDEYDFQFHFDYSMSDTPYLCISEKYLESMLNLTNDLIEATFYKNDYFQKALIAGVININMPCFRKINFKSYDCFNDTKYYKYFGITEDDALKLLKENDIPCENFDEVKAWYGGYKLSNELNEKVFHPLHFYLYLYSKTLKKFCASSHSIMIIKYLLQNPSTKKIWKNFKTNDFKESISHECKFINGVFLTIYDMLFNCSTFKLEPSSLNLILTYLFIDGYLTLDDYQGSDMFNKVKIANISMKKEMDSVLDFHLKKFF